MKIAFCGDSFCLDIFNFYPGTTITELVNPVINSNTLVPFEPYPYTVAKEFNAKILCSGQGGGTLYNSYEVLMKYIQDADYIVYCITDYVRLTNRYRLPITSMNIGLPWETDDGEQNEIALYCLALWNKVIDFKLSEQEEKELRVAVKSYYKMIYDDEYEETVQRGLLREIDSVIKEYKKKCIFLKCYDYSFCHYIPENVVWGNLSLHNDIQRLQEKLTPQEEITEYKPNHLNKQNNRNMANFLIDVIKQDDFTPREIDMREYFK